MICRCGGNGGVTGSCQECTSLGASLFWDLIDGKLTVTAYMRRLRAVPSIVRKKRENDG